MFRRKNNQDDDKIAQYFKEAYNKLIEHLEEEAQLEKLTDTQAAKLKKLKELIDEMDDNSVKGN